MDLLYQTFFILFQRPHTSCASFYFCTKLKIRFSISTESRFWNLWNCNLKIFGQFTLNSLTFHIKSFHLHSQFNISKITFNFYWNWGLYIFITIGSRACSNWWLVSLWDWQLTHLISFETVNVKISLNTKKYGYKKNVPYF